MAPVYFFPLMFFMFFHLPNLLHGLYFNFANFSSETNLTISGDAQYNNKQLSLTENAANIILNHSAGRAVYPEKIHLWDSATNRAADFETHFTFMISLLETKELYSSGGDGVAFFIAANNSIPLDKNGTQGGCLGLISNCGPLNASGIVAVEFDTYMNVWDPSETHVGININSIRSVVTQPWDYRMKNGSVGHARVSYDSKTTNLSMFLTYPALEGNRSLSYQVNLSEYLPEWVTVGFSSSTGAQYEIHYLLSWEFNSTDLPSVPASGGGDGGGGGGVPIGALIAGVVGGSFILIGSTIAILIYFRRKTNQRRRLQNDSDHSMDYEFEHESGPRRFSYADLVQATNNFAEEGKLGEGGFGGVYKGFLPVLNRSVAVKRVSKTSKQGRKEYTAEVKIISKLRHKNLVQLVGWCHEKGEFLLVYEFMPKGSLDSHIFGRENVLSWAQRYKIAVGLASALYYLHEESEQSVVHRDIKSSNVMLDSNFNTKLGDFGLARLMDQELGLIKTTGVAGTIGYMAPEYLSMGKANKASDVYSFGVVALEIACGRKSMEARNEEVQISLVRWAWNSYENGRLLDVADEKLCMQFDMKQMECLLIVGLWCASPDYSLRPSIRQASQVLNFEAPLPNLPKNMPIPKYDAAIPSPSPPTEPLPLSHSLVTSGR